MFLQLFFNTEKMSPNHSIRFCALSMILRASFARFSSRRIRKYAERISRARETRGERKLIGRDVDCRKIDCPSSRPPSILVFPTRRGLPVAVKAADKKGATINLPSASSDRKRSLARNTRTYVG